MYTDDECPTADTAEKWLSFERWLNEKVKAMDDNERTRGLNDFSFGYKNHAEKDAMPDYSQEHYARVFKQQQKASNQFTVGNWYWVQDEAGNLSTQQDRAHTFLPAALVDELIANVLALRPTPDPTVVDLNEESTAWQGPPRTNAQMSMEQNELTLKYLKSKR